MRRNKYFCDALKNAGIDIKKDYFSLTSSEISTVEEIRKAFKYSGKNCIGRSPNR